MIDKKPAIIACVQVARDNDILLCITAEARLVRARRDENADLFWGLRGGGGIVAWPVSEAPAVTVLYRTVAEAAPSELTLIMVHAARIPSPYSAVILFQIGGALNRLEEGHSPVGNRNARYVLNLAGSWEQASDDSANVKWVRGAWNDMKSFSTGGTYINFLTEDEGPERIEAALGTGLRRLAEIKAKWDPRDMFRTNRNIKPV
jgi:hypothetical protein